MALCRSPALEDEVRSLLEQDKAMKRALDVSRRAGDMLLKSEQDELTRAKDYADELLRQEYRHAQVPQIRYSKHYQ